ncbi:MAG: hypothetical protein GWN07_25950, partial [Actinobacteria bacterium]|nr:hypothetical protein [Actinomycetota bacterium]NIS34027.1 hypothetical protein [Actinomycetota bacterium]NIU68833.1 hypothetical protein [Actinomycetota bacterium]NIW30682.1 hypothetical protein [Actinomycetota bacterium]NIX23090.1 hypothetical protein [Actinomycetota bacterium]
MKLADIEIGQFYSTEPGAVLPGYVSRHRYKALEIGHPPAYYGARQRYVHLEQWRRVGLTPEDEWHPGHQFWRKARSLAGRWDDEYETARRTVAGRWDDEYETARQG